MTTLRTGLLVLSACSLLNVISAAADLTSQSDRDAKDFVAGKLIQFNDNGAWCWYQDERVVVDPVNQTMLIGSVGNKAGAGGDDRHGNIELSVYELSSGKCNRTVLHEHQEADDHDA